MKKSSVVDHRPRAGNGTSIGEERYRLLRAAFAHAQAAILAGRYLEAVTVLESIPTDRLGSLVHGSLGQDVTLRHTLGRLIEIGRTNVVKPNAASVKSSASKRRAPLPQDVLEFLGGELSEWWSARNHAVHGMAKLRGAGDELFTERYKRLEGIALNGVRAVLKLDAFDTRERIQNRAGHSATRPDAFAVSSDLRRRLARYSES